jgi:hypothetical protein
MSGKDLSIKRKKLREMREREAEKIKKEEVKIVFILKEEQKQKIL